MFEKQQQIWTETLGSDPMQAVTDIAKHNMEVWSEMQDRFFRSMGLTPDSNKKKGR